MTSVRHILRCLKRFGPVQGSGARILNRSARCMSAHAREKIIEDGNGRKIFPSPHGDVTVSEMLVQEYVWKNVKEYADKTALVCGITGRQYTYSQSRDASNYIARSLKNMGLKKGDVVALIAPNYPETILAFLGILEADLVATTVNPFYTANEIARQLKSSGAKAIITAREIARTALEASRGTLAPGAPFVVIEDGTGPILEGTVPFKDLVEKGKSLPPINSYQTSWNDMAVLPYSSGTTGLPKGVMLTHKNLVSNVEMIEKTCKDKMWLETNADFQEEIPLILPFFHIFGMNGMAIPRLAAGTKIITLPKFMPETFINMLQNHKATGIYLVPPIVLFLNASPYIKKEHLERMHIAISGAAPLADADVERFYEKFNLDHSKMKFCQGYGLTECSPVAFFETTGLKPGSIGQIVAGCEVRLVDSNTNKDISNPRQSGEIWIRGPHVMKGYLHNETATGETIVENGWLKTGDVAYYDEDFDFYVTDRLKELIKVKGFQVPPAELEALLRMHPDVLEAAVIGIPDERCGEVPKAFVLPKPGTKLQEEDIKNFIKGKVSEYKELRGGVTFVDSIPKSASGKILRIQLKNAYK